MFHTRRGTDYVCEDTGKEHGTGIWRPTWKDSTTTNNHTQSHHIRKWVYIASWTHWRPFGKVGRQGLCWENKHPGVSHREKCMSTWTMFLFFFPFLGLSLVGEMSSGVAHSCPEGEGLFLMWLFILTHVLVYLPRVTAFHHLTNVIAQRRMRLHVSEVYIYITICAVFLWLLL